ncbi:MAG: hypothetical protein H3C51_08315 [Rubellimicrobium sp.]|nr:hypothetical protein [Rubellimicrobium sp.]
MVQNLKLHQGATGLPSGVPMPDRQAQRFIHATGNVGMSGRHDSLDGRLTHD